MCCNNIGIFKLKDNRACIIENCNIRANFNYENETKGLYCKEHKQNTMINVKDPTCAKEECNIQPCYNYSSEKRGLYCAKHKKDNMIDIKTAKCTEINCIIIPCYNYPGEKKVLYCLKHKKDGMIDIKNIICYENNCIIRASYNTPDQKKALYCFKHKKETMIDVLNPKCKINGCNIQANQKKYKGYCYRCFIYTFPDSPILRNHKTKERHVVDFLKTTFPDYTIKFDERIQYGCSKRRPDVLIDMGEYIIIVEIDENQHQLYDCSCENKRLMEIFQDCGNRPMAMIRFNPDQYYDIKGKSITSCWETTKDRGLYIIKDSKKKEWETRLNALADAINLQINLTNERKDIDVIHLFYNETLLLL